MSDNSYLIISFKKINIVTIPDIVPFILKTNVGESLHSA
jgi:hypothetical protein